MGPAPAHEETIAKFATRNFGEPAFDRLIDPFISGIYAGDPFRLSISSTVLKSARELERKGGSIGWGIYKAGRERKLKQKEEEEMRARGEIQDIIDPDMPKVKGHSVGSFDEGLEVLPNRLGERLGDCVKLCWSLRSLSRNASGEYTMEFNTPDGAKQIRSRAVVLAIPAYHAATCLESDCPKAAASLRSIEYASLASVTAVYPRSALRDGACQGFGHLIPRKADVSKNLADAGMHGVLLAGNYTNSVAYAACVERGQDVGVEADAFLKAAESPVKK